MEISWLQAIIFALFAMGTSVLGVLPPTIGWYTLARPLIASAIVGLVMGDLQTAIIIGAAVQIVYIALVTPGGTMSSDLRAVCWVGLPLALSAVKASGLDPSSGAALGLAVSIAAAVGVIGSIIHEAQNGMNTIWTAIAFKAGMKGNYKLVYFANYGLSAISQFVLAFIPALLLTKYGTSFAATFKETFPLDNVFIKTFLTLGSFLPTVGIAILLKQIVSKWTDLLIFVFGFVLAVSTGVNLVGAAVIASVIAYIIYMIEMNKSKVQSKEEVL
jgi:mannose PTS system EIIC component